MLVLFAMTLVPDSCPPLNLIHQKARLLSQKLIDTRKITRYDVHGLFSIFGNGDPVEGKQGLRYYIDYENAKVDFVHAHLCMRNLHANDSVVCEVGFNAGLSALLFLETMPRARVVSFDLGAFHWTRAADSILKETYGSSRFPGVVFGDFVRQMPRLLSKDPLRCDVMFVDGSKSYTGRYNALRVLQTVSKPNTVVFMDDITTEECVNGTYASEALHYANCQGKGKGYWPSVRAYNNASSEGWLRVETCASPRLHPHDSICLGRFNGIGAGEKATLKHGA